MKKITRELFDKYTARLAQLNDTGSAANTNIALNPLLQDVNKTRTKLKSMNGTEFAGTSKTHTKKLPLVPAYRDRSFRANVTDFG